VIAKTHGRYSRSSSLDGNMVEKKRVSGKTANSLAKGKEGVKLDVVSDPGQGKTQ